MEHFFKLNNFMLALLMIASITTSCVESEQNPNDVGTEDGSNSFVNAQLPNPNYISFNIGDEVILKGSGFTDSDEIYIHNMDFEYGEDIDGTGYNPINIEAEVKNCTSDKLTFIVPEETKPEENYGFIVYLKRNNKEYKLGKINITNQAYVSNSNRKLIVVKDRLSGNEKVYYQNINSNNEYEFIGEKQEFNTIISRDENEIHINNKYALGEFMVFLENNGEFIPCGIMKTSIDEMIKVYDNFQPGQECTIEGAGFLDDDRIILRERDNNGQEINVDIVGRGNSNNGEFPETITIRIPDNINHYEYNFILKRNGVEHIIRENITIY